MSFDIRFSSFLKTGFSAAKVRNPGLSIGGYWFGSDFNGPRAMVISKPFAAFLVRVQRKPTCVIKQQRIVAKWALSFKAYFVSLHLKNFCI
jgi:hypothetical protein